jgi:NADPH:quinone reductase
MQTDPLRREIVMAAVHKVVEFNVREFDRGRHTYVGIDTLAFSSIESADVLRSVMPRFAGGFLRPFPIAASSIYPLREERQLMPP